MPCFDLRLANLLRPIVPAFVLPAMAGCVKSEPERPWAVIELLAIGLLFSLGLTGGRDLAKAEIAAVLPLLGATQLMHDIYAVRLASGGQM